MKEVIQALQESNKLLWEMVNGKHHGSKELTLCHRQIELNKLATEEIAKSILNTLEGQRFADFYTGSFVNYIEGAEDCPTKQEILFEIKKLFDLKS